MPRLCIAGHRHWSEYPGGVELQTRYVGEALRSAGWEVVHLCHSLQGRTGWQQLADGSLLYWLPPYLLGMSVPRRYLLHVLEEIGADVLYQRGPSVLQESGVVLEWSARRQVPYVFAISSDWSLQRRYPTVGQFLRFRQPRWRSWLLLPYALWADWRLHRTLREASYIFVQHEQQRNWLLRRYRRTGVLVRTLHPELQRPAHKSPTPLVLWMHNYRPHAQLSEALALAQECPQAEFVFVTGRTRPQQLAELRRHRSIPQNVRLLGAVSLAEAEELLERAWVLLHTGRYEGFPNTFVQAWLRQTPVVSLWVDPGALLAQQRLGICAGGDRAKLSQALQRLLQDSALRQELGERCRAYAERMHGLERHRSVLAALFDGIAQWWDAERLQRLVEEQW
jgi:glycosyltransferase involved in cell wall biosynthesis